MLTSSQKKLLFFIHASIYQSSSCYVYCAKCETCHGEYVGETLRELRVRKKEHCDAVSLGQRSKSVIAEHVHEQSMPHEIDWQGMKAIDRARWKRERKVREAFHIQKHKPQLNRYGGVERSKTWSWPRSHFVVRLSSSSVC